MHGSLPVGESDSAVLDASLARLDAISQSARQLADEAAAARNMAAEAAAACRSLVDQIIYAEGRIMAAEWIATVRLSWQLQDRLTGLARVGDGVLLPAAFQTEILNQVERRRAAVAENAVLIEKHNFDGYLDRLSAAQEKRWLDYGHRLMEDASATFDGEDLPQ